MLTQPKLDRDGLRRVAVCAFFKMEEHEQLRDKFKPSRWSVAKAPGDPACFVKQELFVDADDDGNLHIEIAVDDVFETIPQTTAALEEVLTLPQGISDEEEISLMIRGWFRIKEDSPVAKRIVKALLGVSIDVSGYDLTLNGCTFDVMGEGPLYAIQWRTSIEGITEVELRMAKSVKNDDSLLVESTKLLTDAMASLGKDRGKRVHR